MSTAGNHATIPKPTKDPRSPTTGFPAEVQDMYLLLVLGLVDLLLEQLDTLERFSAVCAVDQDVAIRAGEAVLGQLGPIPETPRIIETHLLPHPSVCLDGAYVDVLLGLDHLRTWVKMRLEHKSREMRNGEVDSLTS